jgi:signal transduction histidine kinase
LSLYRKLILFMLLAAVGPLVVLGATLLTSAEDALRERIVETQEQAVRSEAQAVARFVRDRVHALGRAASYFVLTDASEAELGQIPRVMYRATTDAAFAVLIDESGRALAPPAFSDDPAAAPAAAGDASLYADLAEHPPATAEMIQRVDMPLDDARREGAGALVLSGVYPVRERRETAVAAVLPVPGPDGALLLHAVEISLGALQERVARASAVGTLVVVDGTGLSVAHPDADALRLAAEVPTEVPHLATRAQVPLPGLGWEVVAWLPESEAFAPVRRLRVVVAGAGATAVALLLILAAAFTRQVRSALDAVVEGARVFAGGDLAHRIEPPKERELNELAATFNHMGTELLAAREELVEWNEELEDRVEARTRELKEAQAQLIQSQKLAAVGQLGAGVAHEINNPLSSVIGFVQVLANKLKKEKVEGEDSRVKLLGKIEENAKRCREVTSTLLKFSQQSDARARAPVDLNAIVEDVLAMNRGQLEEDNVELELDLAEPAPTAIGDTGQLAQVLLHLVVNARTAMKEAEAPRLTVCTRVEGDDVQLIVRDTGKGMTDEVRERAFEPFFTTKDVWTNLGLGLYTCFRIVEEHGGRMSLDSREGDGATISVTLPSAESAATEES